AGRRRRRRLAGPLGLEEQAALPARVPVAHHARGASAPDGGPRDRRAGGRRPLAVVAGSRRHVRDLRVERRHDRRLDERAGAAGPPGLRLEPRLRDAQRSARARAPAGRAAALGGLTRPPRILILSAAIGEGHDLPARVLRDGILAERPDAYVEVRDALAEAPRMVRWIAAQAALWLWSHPAIDLHLITHGESVDEVRAIAPRSRIVWARGMTKPEFERPLTEAGARTALGLPAEGGIVLVSGGGWGVGDMGGAIETTLTVEGVARVLV